MTTTIKHPWDAVVDSGFGWTDQLVSQWEGRSVYVTRNIDSPEAQVEHVRIVFPDGSKLYIGCDGRGPVDRAVDSGTHWTDVPATEASRILQAWIAPVYGNASITERDTDL